MGENTGWASFGAEHDLDIDPDSVAVEELSAALRRFPIAVPGVVADGDGTVSIEFTGLQQATFLLQALFGGPRDPGGPGSLYDRATSGCLTMSSLGDGLPEDVMAQTVDVVLATAWVWDIHPVMKLRRPAWHASVSVPVADAFQVAAALNSIWHGDSL